MKTGTIFIFLASFLSTLISCGSGSSNTSGSDPFGEELVFGELGEWATKVKADPESGLEIDSIPPLARAAITGDLAKLKNLLSDDVDINKEFTYDEGMEAENALSLAYTFHNPEVVKYLKNCGAIPVSFKDYYYSGNKGKKIIDTYPMYYDGMIHDKYPIQMKFFNIKHFEIDLSFDGEYFYKKNRSLLALSGNATTEDDIVWVKEFDHNGEHTGTFKLNENQETGELNGYWESPAQDKKLDVLLTPIYSYDYGNGGWGGSVEEFKEYLKSNEAAVNEAGESSGGVAAANTQLSVIYGYDLLQILEGEKDDFSLEYLSGIAWAYKTSMAYNGAGIPDGVRPFYAALQHLFRAHLNAPDNTGVLLDLAETLDWANLPERGHWDPKWYFEARYYYNKYKEAMKYQGRESEIQTIEFNKNPN